MTKMISVHWVVACISFIASVAVSNDTCDNQISGLNEIEVCATLDVISFSNDTGGVGSLVDGLEENTEDILFRLTKLEDKIDSILHYLDSCVAGGSPSGPGDSGGTISPEVCTPPLILYSCEQLQDNCPSGYYTITSDSGLSHRMYCNMDKSCGDVGKGWKQIGSLNMFEPTEHCPSRFKTYNDHGVRACGKYSAGCVSVTFPAVDTSYSQVCGRVIGYQVGSPDSSQPIAGIDGAYLDGISLTRGDPRKHIWSFYANAQNYQYGHSVYGDGVYGDGVYGDGVYGDGVYGDGVYGNGAYSCPCTTNNGYPFTTEPFVGNDYFCDSGCHSQYDYNTFNTDPLWDGKICGLQENCNKVKRVPWFYKTLEHHTSEYIELRVCTDEGPYKEDVAVGLYEIYVK